MRRGIFYIARHGETVFNASKRMQGDAPHTPLTRGGFAQAEAMGLALRDALGPGPDLELWSSSAGRALQTLAIIAEHLELDWHDARVDARLVEMDVGAWGGRRYADIHAETGGFIDRATGLLSLCPPGGEWYDAVARRLQSWLGALEGERSRLVIMHGLSSRVLRGLLTGAEPDPQCGAPMAPSLPQGSIARIEEGVESVIHDGGGGHGASGAAPA